MTGRHLRLYPEKTFNQYRTEAQVDRDRILYSPHFGRLAEVTQVRAMDGDFLVHNRLTHSLKVGQVARRIAEALASKQPELAKSLELNPDVAEAAGLAHDLGHPPFGHIAEEKLDELVKLSLGKDSEGYEGNAQSFRIVNALTISDTAPDDKDCLPGLNLTKATLNAILKYPWRYRENEAKQNKWGAYQTEETVFDWARRDSQALARSVEAEIMDWADDITYAIHDMVDFYCAGLIPLHLLMNEKTGDICKREWNSFFDEICLRNKNIAEKRAFFEDALRSAFVLATINAPYTGSHAQTRDLWYYSSILISKYVDAIDLTAPEEHEGRCVSIKEYALGQTTILKELTWHYVIKRSDLATLQHGQQKIIEELYTVFVAAIDQKRWELFPLGFSQLIRDSREVPAPRWAADYISGLTERQVVHLYRRIIGNHGI
jgi:dGTPase